MTDAGYSIRQGVFERADMTRALGAIAEAALDRTRAGARHVLNVPIVRDIANDGRLLAIAGEFVGASPVAFRATLFDKSADANWLVVWHQDTALPLRARVDDPHWGPWSTKAGVWYAHAPSWALERVVALRVSLDDSTDSNGPLRVLPDTHRRGVLDDAQIETLARDIPSVDCIAAAGAVVVMRPLTVHASSKSTNDRPRRVLHIEYAASVALGQGFELTVA